MKIKTLGLGVFAFALALGTIAGSAFAYQGNPGVKGFNYSAERHTAMVQAFETKDYTAWKNLMAGRGRVTQAVNEDNFARLAEARALALQGKTDEARKIWQELGLGQKNGSGRGGFGRGMNKCLTQ